MLPTNEAESTEGSDIAETTDIAARKDSSLFAAPSTKPDWRAGEILRLTDLTSELHRRLAEQATSQEELRRINAEYAARVGHIQLQEEAARCRMVELAEVRQDAAAHVAVIASLRDELAALQQTSAAGAAEVEAVRRAEREAAQGALRERDQSIAELQGESARRFSVVEALQRELGEERRRRAVAEVRADALDTRAAALQEERDRLRKWHDAVTATMRWQLVGRPGGRLDLHPNTAQAS